MSGVQNRSNTDDQMETSPYPEAQPNNDCNLNINDGDMSENILKTLKIALEPNPTEIDNGLINAQNEVLKVQVELDNMVRKTNKVRERLNAAKAKVAENKKFRMKTSKMKGAIQKNKQNREDG